MALAAHGHRYALRAFASAACTTAPALSLKQTVDSLERNADVGATFAVTGASRGLGAEFCRAILARSRGRVIAFARNPGESQALQDLASAYDGRLIPVEVDVTDEHSIARAASEVSCRCGHIDVLLNVAGVLHENSRDRMPERSLAQCRQEWMQHVYAVNALGPVLFTAGLLPLLTSRDGSSKRARLVANLSARVGSIGDNRIGGWWSYRMSKAALNMATRNMAIEFKRKSVPLHAIALHPGTTDTGLSMPFQKNVKPEQLFTIAFSVERLLEIIESVERAHSGFVYAWDGKPIDF